MIIKGLKYVLYALAGIFLFAFFLLFLSQTKWFRSCVKGELIKIAPEYLNGELKIGDIEGTLFSNVEFTDVSLISNDTVIATFSSLKLHYNLFALKNKRIQIDSIQLNNPSFYLRQLADSTWNFQQLILSSEDDTSTSVSAFDYQIDAPFVQLKNGFVQVSSFIDLVPDTISGINLKMNANYSSTETRAQIQQFNLKTANPTLQINEFSTSFLQNKNGITIDSLWLRTAGSNFIANGNFVSLNQLQGFIKAEPLDSGEVAIFVPSLHLACSPEITLRSNVSNDTTSMWVELKNEKESIILDASFSKLAEALNNSAEKVPYRANVLFKNVTPENWVKLDPTKAKLNGNVALNGTDLFDLNSTLNVKANLANSVYNKTRLKMLSVNGKYEKGNVSGRLTVQTKSGKLLFNGNVLNVNSELPEYKLRIQADSFNVTSFIPEMEATWLNGTFQANGKGFASDVLIVEGQAAINNCQIYHVPINLAQFNFDLKNNQINIDSIKAGLPGGTIQGVATYQISSGFLATDLYAELDSVSFLNHFIVLPLSFESLKSTIKLEGEVPDLQFSGVANGINLNGYSAEIGKMAAAFSGQYKNDTLATLADISARNTLAGGVNWDTISVNMDYGADEIKASIYANWKDTLEVNLRTKLNMGDTMHIAIPELTATTFLSKYYLPDTLQSVQIKDNGISFQNLWIKDLSKPDFNLKLNGNLALTENDRIQFDIENLDLNQLNSFIPMEDSIQGKLSSTFVVTGTTKSPVLQGIVTIENPAYGAYSFGDVSGKLQYKNKNGNIEFSLPELDIQGFANAPMEVFYDSAGFVFNPPETFDAAIKIDTLFLSQPIQNDFSPVDVSGNLSMDLKASGSIESPLINGYFRIGNGRFVNTEYGINYENIRALIRFDGDKISVDTLLIKQGKGKLSATGEMAFDSTIFSGNMINSTLVVKAEKFDVIKSRKNRLQIDANTFIKSKGNKPEFGGEINVLQSTFYLPSLMQSGNEKSNLEDEPLLIQAISKTSDTTLSQISVKKEEAPKTQNDFQENLTGRIKIDIPRNTWIRSDDMNLELRGDMELVKAGPDFELFGNVEIVRGHYILYGRKLVIQEGEIIFQGGEEFDPTLNFNAEYTYRDSNKLKRKLAMYITGLLSEPSVRFTLDGNETTETDAVSILIFGKSIDEMDTDSQNGLTGAMGSNMVAKVLTTQLSKTLGTRFNLDMIEINATENWQSAAFVVGKYITNDLFLTYQRGFGETEGEEITPETITLEYELNRIFFLHLQSGSSKTSGLDVILKFEGKNDK